MINQELKDEMTHRHFHYEQSEAQAFKEVQKLRSDTDFWRNESFEAVQNARHQHEKYTSESYLHHVAERDLRERHQAELAA